MCANGIAREASPGAPRDAKLKAHHSLPHKFVRFKPCCMDGASGSGFAHVLCMAAGYTHTPVLQLSMALAFVGLLNPRLSMPLPARCDEARVQTRARSCTQKLFQKHNFGRTHLPTFRSSGLQFTALNLVADNTLHVCSLPAQIRALESRVAGLVCEIGDAQRCARAHALAARQAEIGARSLHDALARAAQVVASPRICRSH